MANFLKKYWYYIVIFLLCCLIVFGYNYFKNDSHNIIYMNDTTIVTRYQTQLVHDTTISFLEKIKWMKSDPEIVYYQKVDTVFIEKTKDMDLILQAEKKGDKLKIIAINQNGKVIKERYYDVYGDFIATSTVNDVYVKTKIWEFYGLANFALNSKISELESWKSYNIKPSLEIGIKWKNDVSLSLEPIYNITTGGAELQLNLKKKLF